MAKGSNATPQLPEGLKFLGPLLQNLGQVTKDQFGDIFSGNTALSGGLDQLAGQQQGLLGQAASQASQVGQPSTDAFLQGLQTGFAPDVASQLQAALQPGAQFSTDRATESIQGNAAAMGLLDSTGTGNTIGNAATQIQNQLQQTVGQAQAQAQLQGQNIQANFAQQGLNAAGQTAQGFTNPIGQAVQQGQFTQQLPLNAVSALQGGVSSLPLFTPAVGPSPAPAIGGAIGAGVGSAFGGIGAVPGAAIGTGVGSLFAKS